MYNSIGIIHFEAKQCARSKIEADLRNRRRHRLTHNINIIK
jgi:hypothetical protein